MDTQRKAFFNEISLMMFGFGDSHIPNPETVQFVENIVLEQLQIIIQEALKYSTGDKTLKGEELVFLMRHNKYKMRRFVRYLCNKQLKMYAQSLQSPVIQIDIERPKNELLDFIERIDETGEFTDLSEVDEVKQARAIRADRISQALDESKYLEFCKARCVSFNCRGTTHRDMEKLRTWIDPKKEVIFKQGALDVLGYFAYETVATIVDYVFLIRMDAKCAVDPLSYARGSYYTAVMFNYEQKFNGNSVDFSKIFSGQQAITVAEVKEVMRRTCSPQSGKLNFGGKVPPTHYIFAL